MSVATFTTPTTQASDAEFQAFIQAFTAAMSSAGMVQATDTGQVDATTVARATTNNVAGYQIWKFADASQTSKPIFLKIEYGSAGTNSRLQMWVTVGSGTNGAGTITGTTYFARSAAAETTGASPSVCWVAAGDSYFNFTINGTASGNQINFAMERTRAADGTPDLGASSGGVYCVIVNGPIAGVVASFCSYDGAESNSATVAHVFVPNSSTAAIGAGTAVAFPHTPMGKRQRQPCRTIFAALSADGSAGQAVTIASFLGGGALALRICGATINSLSANTAAAYLLTKHE